MVHEWYIIDENALQCNIKTKSSKKKGVVKR